MGNEIEIPVEVFVAVSTSSSLEVFKSFGEALDYIETSGGVWRGPARYIIYVNDFSSIKVRHD